MCVFKYTHITHTLKMRISPASLISNIEVRIILYVLCLSHSSSQKTVSWFGGGGLLLGWASLSRLLSLPYSLSLSRSLAVRISTATQISARRPDHHLDKPDQSSRRAPTTIIAITCEAADRGKFALAQYSRRGRTLGGKES